MTAEERVLEQRVFKVGIRREREHRIRVISYEEEAAMLDWCDRMGDPLLKAYIIVSLDTGFRQGEVLRIEPRDIVEGATLWAYDTKGGGNRSITLTNRAIRELSALAEGKPRDAKLFPLNADRLRDRWRQMASDMELANDKGFIPHAMRHTFCTRLLALGVDIITVKNLAGHASVTTTQRYAHSAPEWAEQAIRKLCTDPDLKKPRVKFPAYEELDDGPRAT